jgi:hypothetical protein
MVLVRYVPRNAMEMDVALAQLKQSSHIDRGNCMNKFKPIHNSGGIPRIYGEERHQRPDVPLVKIEEKIKPNRIERIPKEEKIKKK